MHCDHCGAKRMRSNKKGRKWYSRVTSRYIDPQTMQHKALVCWTCPSCHDKGLE